MTSQDARHKLNQALDLLKSVQDGLGSQMCQTEKNGSAQEAESRNISDLHDRAARAINAYYKGR
ncbi:hypothetical protein NBRC116601_16450 [Cognatishimia sp. WU-CL00825]|uniref:hypothetical protein n=1 Tax=Cognatishimia sp. WU-CL00825 TaxID=3127658 RepID=UPI0031039832